MYILVAISALCFCTLVLTVVAINRHVRSSQATANPQHDFAHHLFAAAADQNTRGRHTLMQQSVKDIMAKKNYKTPPLQGNTRQQSASSKLF